MAVLRGGILSISELASGTVDNLNREFSTSRAYVPGTLKVYLNGIRLITGEHFEETGSNLFELSDAPIGDSDPDVVEVEYQIL